MSYVYLAVSSLNELYSYGILLSSSGSSCSIWRRRSCDGIAEQLKLFDEVIFIGLPSTFCNAKGGLLQLCFQGKRSSSSIIHEISVSKVVFDVMILSREKENRSSYYNLSHYSKEKKVSRCIIICQNCIIDTQYYMPLPIAYDIILPNNSTMHMY